MTIIRNTYPLCCNEASSTEENESCSKHFCKVHRRRSCTVSSDLRDRRTARQVDDPPIYKGDCKIPRRVSTNHGPESRGSRLGTFWPLVLSISRNLRTHDQAPPLSSFSSRRDRVTFCSHITSWVESATLRKRELKRIAFIWTQSSDNKDTVWRILENTKWEWRQLLKIMFNM